MGEPGPNYPPMDHIQPDAHPRPHYHGYPWPHPQHRPLTSSMAHHGPVMGDPQYILGDPFMPNPNDPMMAGAGPYPRPVPPYDGMINLLFHPPRNMAGLEVKFQL